jgi:hypothetical protein
MGYQRRVLVAVGKTSRPPPAALLFGKFLCRDMHVENRLRMLTRNQ